VLLHIAALLGIGSAKTFPWILGNQPITRPLVHRKGATGNQQAFPWIWMSYLTRNRMEPVRSDENGDQRRSEERENWASLVFGWLTAWKPQHAVGIPFKLSSLARTLESWVRIPLKTWISVCVCSEFV
jgi:hypothetical protein